MSNVYVECVEYVKCICVTIACGVGGTVVNVAAL